MVHPIRNDEGLTLFCSSMKIQGVIKDMLKINRVRSCLFVGLTAILMGNLVSSCSSHVTTFACKPPESLQCDDSKFNHAKLIIDAEDLVVWLSRGRLYVFASQESGLNFDEISVGNAGFLESGAGPSGEDVVFETDPSRPELTKELQERFHAAPILLWRVGREYSVWKQKNRIFILGPDPIVERDFIRSRELVLSKTFFGAGPHGETVVVEASKSKNQFADLLMERFNARPILIETRCPEYFVWKEMGRLIVVGSVESSLDLESGRELRSSRALIGAGQNGETVVFETSGVRPELLQRLAGTYFGEGNIPAGLIVE
jgi:hypothetical protein